MEESEVAHLYLIDKVSCLRHSHLFKGPILGLELSLGSLNCLDRIVYLFLAAII